MKRSRVKWLTVVLLMAMFIAVVGVATWVGAYTSSCWIHDDFSSWCEPGTVGCTNWPSDIIVDLGTGAAWGGAGNQDMEFYTGDTFAYAMAYGPTNCSPVGFCTSTGHFIILNVDIKLSSVAPVNTTAGVGIGLFTQDSVPMTNFPVLYNDSVYMGELNILMGTAGEYVWGSFWAAGYDYEQVGGLCIDCCTPATCGLGCAFTFDAAGPYYVMPHIYECPEYLQNQSTPDTNWHNFKLAFNYDTGETVFFYDGTYMGVVFADDMAHKSISYELIAVGYGLNTVYWDNFSVGDGIVNGYPLSPTNLLVNGVPSGGCVYNATPNMSCTAWHSNGSYLDLQEIEVAIDSGFHYFAWDSGMMDIPDVLSGSTSTVAYSGSSLIWNTKYYWRTKFWDRYGVSGDWSETSTFTYGAVNCGTFGNASPHGIFPPTNISVYGTDCDPDIFLRDLWRDGAAAMGYACPVTFEQLILGLAAIPIGIAVAFAVNFTMAGVLASLLWFGGLTTMHVYPWWIVLVVPIFLLSLWFTLRRTGA